MIDADEGLLYIATHRRELDTVFQFEVSWAADDVVKLKRSVQQWYETFDGQALGTVTLANHDWPRLISRCGCDGEYRMQSAKLLATFLLTAPGVPFLYQGDEIGMTNVCFPSIEYHRDIETLNRLRGHIERGMTPEQAFAAVQPLSRDNARTPMQWDGSLNAGFTTGTPWLGVNPNYVEINVAREESDPQSVLAYYRRLVHIRRAHPGLAHGRYREMDVQSPHLYAYERTCDGGRLFVVLNFSGDEAECTFPTDMSPGRTQVLIGNYPDSSESRLRPWEARVYGYPQTDDSAA